MVNRLQATICVLLSTYNGEKYIKQQLDSILGQRGVEVKLHIRDDGSTDNTVRILKKYKKRYPTQIVLDVAENIGWEKSFLKLLYDADDADYYAFADQDDVWFPEKLYRATKLLEEEKDGIALYVGNVWITDENLKVLHIHCPENVNMLDREIGEILISPRMAGGLTYVFTTQARLKVLQIYPHAITGHDALTLKTCLYLGHVIYDDEPMAYYRQHEQNVTVTTRRVFSRINQKWRTLVDKKEAKESVIATILLETFRNEAIKNEKIHKLLQIIKEYPKNTRNKIRLIRYPNVKRRTMFTTLLLYAKILLGKF